MERGNNMAVFHVAFESKILKRSVNCVVILPVEENRLRPFRTLYLLHGFNGQETDWIYRTNILSYVAKKNIAVVMPAGENSFYINSPQNSFADFIGNELVTITRDMFPLSTKRSDTCIAGLSMGGYGAIHNGLLAYKTFGAIGALSSALFRDTLLKKERYGSRDSPFTVEYLTALFGNLDLYEGSDLDYFALTKKVHTLCTKNEFPRLYVACGLQDALLKQNREYHEFLMTNTIEHVYNEEQGEHSWNFWDLQIKKIISWF